jgi:hypothetical protein
MSVQVHPRYSNPLNSVSVADQGRDLLGASGMGVRPAIGGRTIRFMRRILKTKRANRSKRANRANKVRRTYRNKRTKGGFIPSIMEPFISSVSKYIVPLVLYSGYKLMTTSKKGNRKH